MDSNNDLSRRAFMRTTGATGALAVGLGAGIAGNAAGNLAGFDELSVSSDNRIVDESGNTFKMRGLNIPDPKRLAITKHIRGKDREQIINMLTNNEAGWHPRVIRIPAQPTDIGEHPNGNTGERYGEDSPPEIDNDRTKMIPSQPVEQDNGDYGAFTREQLQNYLETYMDPAVEQCKERGVYCIIDFHRHWHEQPPGDGNGGWDNVMADAEAENHLPYNSKNTLYWAHNTYYDKDKPMSWGWVDGRYRSEEGNATESDIQNGNTPYDKWEVNEPLVQEAIMFWDEVAGRYADMDHVIYEPYNEPTAPGIWGPVSGCGAYKQQPLWETFRKDFAAPIMDKVREYAPDKLLMMGLPGWCQATQALNWGGFDEEGFENVAAVWHNYAGHSVSQEENWLNGPASGCGGWEPEEAQGLQDAQEVHPIAVTEFGWQDPGYTQENTENETDISKWLQGSTTGQGTTYGYGEPFLDEMETDDRISWVAWCADPRWLTAMFKVDFPIAEKTLELNNGSWYDTPESEYPVNCEELPCDWALWQNPNMGAHIKQRLADNKDDLVPFDTETHGPVDPDPNPEGPSWPEDATDPDGDDYYEDLNGNEETDFQDVVEYFNNMDNDQMAANSEYYDYNGNDEIDYADLVELFKEVS